MEFTEQCNHLLLDNVRDLEREAAEHKKERAEMKAEILELQRRDAERKRELQELRGQVAHHREEQLDAVDLTATGLAELHHHQRGLDKRMLGVSNGTRKVYDAVKALLDKLGAGSSRPGVNWGHRGEEGYRHSHGCSWGCRLRGRRSVTLLRPSAQV